MGSRHDSITGSILAEIRVAAHALSILLALAQVFGQPRRK
jgi:hypothetical protein